MVDDDVGVLPSTTGDRVGRLVPIDLSLIQTEFRRAYVEITPATDVGIADDTDLPFVLNLDPTRTLDVIVDVATFLSIVGAKRTLSSSDDFWAVVLASCYQRDPAEDYDPVTQLFHVGLAASGEGVACVFMETTQDDDFTPLLSG